MRHKRALNRNNSKQPVNQRSDSSRHSRYAQMLSVEIIYNAKDFNNWN